MQQQLQHQFGKIGQNNNPTGFTNNWNESRSYQNLFIDKYNDYATSTNQNDVSNTNREVLTSCVERTPVSDLYFSERNINHMKYLLARLIKDQTKYEISPASQSNAELTVVMRGVFLTHAKHLPNNIEKQVIELNYITLMDLYPRTISNIRQYLTYTRDHGSMPLPMAPPQHMSSAGTRSNRSITDVFI